MSEINEKRSDRRVLAVCRALNENREFLGFTLDLTQDGIHLIVEKTFADKPEFETILTQNREGKKSYPEIKVRIRKMWRRATNDEYDQVGGKIIEVDNQEALEDLVRYCDNKAKEKYQFDLRLVEDK